LFQNAPETRFWGEAHGSISVQERQPIQLDERSASAREKAMRYFVFAFALLGAAAASARAQDAIPDLKGTWSGKGKSIVFGTNPHHPGPQTAADQPRVRDIETTYIVDGQEGRLAWGRSSSTAANSKSHSRGRLRATTRRSSAPIWTAISASPSSRRIA
jgi:hypothetical protein